MNPINRFISSVHLQLRLSEWLRCLLAGVSAGMLTGIFFPGHPLGPGAGLGVFGVCAVLLKPWADKRDRAVRMLHSRIGEAEYSLGLLGKEDPNVAEQLQLERLVKQMAASHVPKVWYRQLSPYLLVFLLAVLTYSVRMFWEKSLPSSDEAAREKAGSRQAPQPVSPVFRNAEVFISPPAYTAMRERRTQDLNVSALAGTDLRWQVRFSGKGNLKVMLNNSRGEELAFTDKGDVFEYADRLTASGLYALRAYWNDSLIYQSDYYRLEAVADAPPRIEPASRQLYRFHFLNDPKNLRIDAKVSDDFLVKQVYVVATVARGSGENVKFREVRFPVSNTAFKTGKVSKILDLKALNFTPGDELYYYWAAVDNKAPEPNFSKSDTYFLVYKDTSALRESELATMAVNILPEYFRSQRQIIIDTEKLIVRRGKVSKQAFNSASNEIGFDQKALRIRYGQYLGEEEESSIGGHGHSDSDNPLEGFMHKHDSEEEEHHDHSHAHEHSHEKPASAAKETGKDPLAELLEAYVHSHDDAETNTFYEQSTRSILKTALENMWQSELHLRLYEPEKALPYEHKALELLKQVQQKARVFIAKTSYDPPPIKENELRMKGELKKFNRTFSTEVHLSREQVSVLAAKVAGYAESDDRLSGPQKQTVALLSNRMSDAIVNAGMDKWKMLALLQKLLNDQPLTTAEKAVLKTGLYSLSSIQKNAQPPPGGGDRKMEKAFWKNLL